MNQLQIHKRIDDFFKAGVETASVDTARELAAINGDSKRYFFNVADEAWLEWIFENNFFDELKKPAKDITKYSYTLPELDYLTRMAEKKPELVEKIISSVGISKETFNPEVIDRFFWIAGLLPADQIKPLLQKILKENWVQLMAPFNRSGYEYQKMVEKLKEAKAYDALIELSKIILTVRAKEELDAMEGFSISGKLFYLHDLTETGIFEVLLEMENEKREEALKVILEVLSRVVTSGKDQEEKVFENAEPFYLLDVDLFTVELNTSRKSYSKDDVENLVATAKKLIELLFVAACDDVNEVRRLYSAYILELPDSRTLYRLALFAITRCPNSFREEIKNSFFRVFNVGERYFEIEGGAEYHRALIAGFGALDDGAKREYVSKVFEYFGADLEDKDKESWRRRDGREILTYIQSDLTPEEASKAEAVLGKILSAGEISPRPVIGEIRSGFVEHKSPVNLADLSVADVVVYLKTEGNPKTLREKYKDDDFFYRPGSEGLGDAIREDFKKRKTEYMTNLSDFFSREDIAPVYVYALFRQIEDMLRAKESFSDDDYLRIFNFFDLIRKSGEGKEFEKGEERTHLPDWITVHNIVTDVLLSILALVKGSKLFDGNKEQIIAVIKYLLSIKNSPSMEDEDRESSDPSHVAINSVRGQAFRALVQFAYNEGDKTISGEVKELYEEVLDHDMSNAVRFTLGQFLASFYFRDPEFIRGLLPKIFPKEKGKEKLYFAAWEGYLASSLYKELFEELSGYYEYAIKINPDDYPERKYLKGLDESLAVHFALAYAHLDLDVEDPLFALFWRTPNETRHYEFVSFIGRSCISRDQGSDTWFKENNVSKDKLISFWDWVLGANIAVEKKAFSGFGFWVNPDKEIIDEKIIVKNLAQTLKKSDGEIDWDYGLMRRLKTFAEIDPVNTLAIIKSYLLSGGELNPNRRVPMFSLESEIKDALTIIYRDPSLKDGVEDLINILIEKGSSSFWGLKEVIVE